MPVPRTGVTNAHYCPPFFNVATRDLNSGSHACMAKSSLSPAPSWLVVGDRSPYAALEGLTLESGMASTSSSPAFGLCSPEIPRFLPHCLPPFHRDAISRRVRYLSSSSSLQFRWFLPFIKYWGGGVEMLNLGRTALSLEFMLAHVQYSLDTLRFTVFN